MPSKKGRVPLYSGRKLQLIHLVRRLEAAKKRPVCSADIRAYLAEQDQPELGYIQCFGQILIKAARPGPDAVPRLHSVGMHRNRLYYTAGFNEAARESFERFCAQERAAYLIIRGFLHCLPPPSKIDTALEKAAVFSLARVIHSTLPLLETKHLAIKLQNWIQTYTEYVWTEPECHQVDRGEALRILQGEVHDRAPYIPSMNFNRHLARLCPTLLRGQAEPVYCEEAIRCYCATVWPTRAENLDKQTNMALQWILVMARVAIDTGGPIVGE